MPIPTSLPMRSLLKQMSILIPAYARVLNGFQGVSPVKDSLVDHKLSALIAFLEVGKKPYFFSRQDVSLY